MRNYETDLFLQKADLERSFRRIINLASGRETFIICDCDINILMKSTLNHSVNHEVYISIRISQYNWPIN